MGIPCGKPGVGNSRDSSGLADSLGILSGWALQGFSKNAPGLSALQGSCGDTLGLGIPGILWGCSAGHSKDSDSYEGDRRWAYHGLSE